MAKNYLSNKDIQILTGVGIPSDDGATGATGSIYSNISDGSLWSQTTGSTSGWVQLADGNLANYLPLAGGTMTGDISSINNHLTLTGVKGIILSDAGGPGGPSTATWEAGELSLLESTGGGLITIRTGSGAIEFTESGGGVQTIDFVGGTGGYLYSLPSATGTIALTSDINSLYSSDGSLSGSRTIETDGNGLVLKDSVAGDYFDFHSFKGTGGWSIGTTFSSLTVDWSGGGTNAGFGQLFASEGMNFKVGNWEEENNFILELFTDGLNAKPAGPTQASSIGDPANSSFRIRTFAGTTIGLDDSTSMIPTSNGGTIEINRPDAGPVIDVEGANLYNRGNNLRYNGQGLTGNTGAGGYTIGWGPNADGVYHRFLYLETAGAGNGDAKLLYNNGSSTGGISFYVSNSANIIRYGQIEATVNCYTAVNELACFNVRAGFKTSNSTTTLGNITIDTVYDETAGNASVSLAFGTVTSFQSLLQFTCGVAGEANDAVWNIEVKVHGAGTDVNKW